MSGQKEMKSIAKPNVLLLADEENVEEESKERSRSVLQSLTPFIVENNEDGTGILIHSTQKEGPLRLTHREALALAEIIKNLSQSQ